MKIEVSNIVAGNMPYYTVRSGNGTYYAIGFEQVISFVNEAKSRGEGIEVEDISVFLNEHNKLLEAIKI